MNTQHKQAFDIYAFNLSYISAKISFQTKKNKKPHHNERFYTSRRVCAGGGGEWLISSG